MNYNVERLLKTPRTTRYLLRKFGREFIAHLPAGTVRGPGLSKDDQVYRTYHIYYWLPDGTDRQARQLATLEIDIAKARKVVG